MADQDFNPTDEEQRAIQPDIPSLRTQEGVGANTAGQSDGGGASDGTGDSNTPFKFNRGGDSDGAAGSDKSSDKSASPSDLAGAENSAPWKNSLAVASPTGGISAKAVKNMFLGTSSRRRKTAAGSIAGLAGGGIIATLIIVSGPAQLVHLSETLERNFDNSNSASANRTNSLLRYAGANDAGETRVGLLSRQYLRGTFDDLNNIGIELQTNANSGLKSATIDSDKLSEKYPELKGMSTEEKQNWLADQFSLSADQVVPQGNDSFLIDAGDFPIKSVSSLKGNLLSLLGNGDTVTGIKNRILGKYLGLPSIFHPISRSLESKYNQLLNTNERKAAVEAEEQSLEQPSEALADGAVADASLKGSSVTTALTVTGGACLVYNSAGDIETIDRYRVEYPAFIMALHVIAIGEQVKSGQDISAAQAGAVEESFTDSTGHSIFGGKALQATEGVTSPSGTDLPGKYKQAFAGGGIASSIRTGTDDFFNKASLGAVGASGACGTAGTIVQVFGTLLAGAVSTFSDAVSDGTLTPVLVSFWGLKESVNIGETALAGNFLQQFVLSKTTNATLAKDAFSGPVGGDLLAYGARTASAIGGAAEGAIPLSGTNASTLAAQQQQQDQQQFRSESFFARMFDVNDDRSLAGKLADSVNPSAGQDFASATGGFSHIGSNLLSNLSSIFLPKSQAATTYDWGFPEYGIPDSILNDPNLANPYTNAANMAAVLDGSNGQGYIDKAMTCFGVSVEKDSGAWDVIATQPVDINSDAYNNADCGNLNDPNLPDWKQMILFVFDTRTMQAVACYQGDDQSCTEVGTTSDVSSGSSSTPSAPSSTSGYQNPFRDVQNLGTSRVDEGVDFTGSGPVYAIGNGTIVGPTTNSGWPGGTFIVYQLTDGPAKGKYVYMAENCDNIQVHAGETVTSSTVLCTMVDAYPHIETGWADGSAIGNALAKGVYIELPSGTSYATAYGQNFRELLDSLNVGVKSCYDFPGAKLSGEPLPGDWPTWTSNPALTSGSQGC